LLKSLVISETSFPASLLVLAAKAADDEGEDVPRDPADHERTEDDGDGAQRLASPVVAARQLLQPLPLRV